MFKIEIGTTEIRSRYKFFVGIDSLKVVKKLLPISYELIIMAHAGATLRHRGPIPENKPLTPLSRKISNVIEDIVGAFPFNPSKTCFFVLITSNGSVMIADIIPDVKPERNDLQNKDDICRELFICS